MTNSEIIGLTHKYVTHTYKRFQVAMVRGEGTRLFDADSKSYLDFVAGLAVTNLGHCHPKVVEALRAQAGASLPCLKSLSYSPTGRACETSLRKLICR